MKNLKQTLQSIIKEEVRRVLLKEALNKDIKQFGKDLDNRFKAAGFKTKIIFNGQNIDALAKEMQTIQKAVLFDVFENKDMQTLTVYANPSDVRDAEKIINKFQLSDFNGPVLSRGWTSKQVQGKINPGEIVKQDADKSKGMWYFYRLANVGTRTVNI
jgi:hypothetical protein